MYHTIAVGTEPPLQNAPSPVEQIRHTAEKLFENARGSHDWEHTLRVVRLCEAIGPSENADMQVLKIAAFLHDIGRCGQDDAPGSGCHAERGSRLARPLVTPLALSGPQKDNILHCLQAHLFRGSRRPATIEARVLFDADKLDAIGAVGIARAYLFAGELGARLHNTAVRIEDTRPYSREDTGYREYKLKLCKIKDRMLTEPGRRLARERHRFMTAFFNRFLAEHAGRC